MDKVQKHNSFSIVKADILAIPVTPNNVRYQTTAYLAHTKIQYCSQMTPYKHV
jgi:hypothetical protein